MLLLVVIFIPTTSNASNNMLSGSSGGRNYYLYVPSYYNKDVQRVIKNAINWCSPTENHYPRYGHFESLEK